MSMLLFRLRDYEGAAASGQKAIELNPNDPESYIARGNLLYYTNRSREALEVFKKVQLLDPLIRRFTITVFADLTSATASLSRRSLIRTHAPPAAELLASAGNPSRSICACW